MHFNQKEPIVIYATADTNLYIPICNLSTTHKHYKTYTNLCSTAESTLEAACNLMRLHATPSSVNLR